MNAEEQAAKLLPCSFCGNEGRIPIGERFVTRDMAIDAGDRRMEGMSLGVEYEDCRQCPLEARAAIAAALAEKDAEIARLTARAEKAEREWSAWKSEQCETAGRLTAVEAERDAERQRAEAAEKALAHNRSILADAHARAEHFKAECETARQRAEAAKEIIIGLRDGEVHRQRGEGGRLCDVCGFRWPCAQHEAAEWLSELEGAAK